MRLSRLRRDIENGSLVGNHAHFIHGDMQQTAENSKEWEKPETAGERKRPLELEPIETRSGNKIQRNMAEPLFQPTIIDDSDSCPEDGLWQNVGVKESKFSRLIKRRYHQTKHNGHPNQAAKTSQ